MAAATISKCVRNFGKNGDTITLTGTNFADTGTKTKVYSRENADDTWAVVTAAKVTYVSSTSITVELATADWNLGLNDIGVSESTASVPDAILAGCLYFYAAGTNNPDNVIKGAPDALYIEGLFLGQTHGGLALDHGVETGEIVSDQSLVALRTVKTGESFKMTVPLAEVSLENMKEVWGISATIVTEGSDRVLTFGGDVDILEKEVLIIVPAGSGKKWAITFYRCAIISPGTMNWKRDEQVDLALEINILADTSRTAGDQVGRIREYTPA
jgi:hypothetical protein